MTLHVHYKIIKKDFQIEKKILNCNKKSPFQKNYSTEETI